MGQKDKERIAWLHFMLGYMAAHGFLFLPKQARHFKQLFPEVDPKLIDIATLVPASLKDIME